MIWVRFDQRSQHLGGLSVLLQLSISFRQQQFVTRLGWVLVGCLFQGLDGFQMLALEIQLTTSLE